jgi:hypothetical protein
LPTTVSLIRFFLSYFDMKPSIWFTFTRRVIYLIIDVYCEGHIIDICMCCLSRQKIIYC